MGSIFNGQNMTYAAGAMKAVGGIVEGQQGGAYLEHQAAQAEADARAERELGAVRAARVRKAGAMVRNEATAAQGASGSSVNSKSAEDVREYIDRTSGSDALMELYGGAARGRSLEATAAGYRSQAGLTRASGFMGAGGSLLASAGRAFADQQKTDRWLRRTNDMSVSYPDQYSLSDPAYG